MLGISSTALFQEREPGVGIHRPYELRGAGAGVGVAPRRYFFWSVRRTAEECGGGLTGRAVNGFDVRL